jgi:exodeoxyribonuclease III
MTCPSRFYIPLVCGIFQVKPGYRKGAAVRGGEAAAQNRVHQTEGGCVGANAEGEDDDRGNIESRRLEHCAERRSESRLMVFTDTSPIGEFAFETALSHQGINHPKGKNLLQPCAFDSVIILAPQASGLWLDRSQKPARKCRARTLTLECESMFTVASWNLNSVRSRLTHVTAWLRDRVPDVMLLQELKGTEFPSEAFKSLGYESVAVTQKAYNGVAILSRHPMKTIAKALVGDDSDSDARFLETMVNGIRIVNIYAPNGNPIGSERFAFKLAWMDRLTQQMIRWKQDDVPTLIGGDFNVIPEDIDCHKPSSWERDALFQPEPRDRYRAMLKIGYTDAFRSLHVGEMGHFTFWDYFRQAFQNNRGIRIDHFLLSPKLADRLVSCEIDKGPRGQEKPSDHTPIIVTLADLP